MKHTKIYLKILVCFIFIYLSATIISYAQVPSIIWDKNYGGSEYEEFDQIKQTSDGGYISGGWSYSPISGEKSQANWDISNNSPDYWIVKSDAAGIKQWDKRFGGTSIENGGYIIQTSDGGYLLGGTSASGINGDKSQASKGAFDYWIVKLDALGNIQWEKTFGGTSNDFLFSIIQTSDGGYLLGGYSTSGIGADRSENSRGKDDYWILKTDPNGIKMWDKRFGGSLEDWAYSVIQTSDGGYLIGGISVSGAGGDKTQANRGSSFTSDIWIVKTDALGNKLWDKRFGTVDDEWCNVVLQTSDGGYVLGGYSSGGNNGDRTVNSRGTWDYWIVKVDASGNKLWDKRYGGSNDDFLYSMQITTDGGFIMGGFSRSGLNGDKSQVSRGADDYWIIKTDPIGTIEWDKTMGGTEPDLLFSISQTIDGGYICGGHSSSPISGEKTQALVGVNDYWIVKLSPITPLPIELISFTGKNSEDNIILMWITASELNNDYFTLERSKDGNIFESIGTMNGAGTSNETENYLFIDTKPFSGINYYRLKQTDYNGESKNSKIIALQNSPAEFSGLVISPNPANTSITLIYSNWNENDEVQILNALGEIIVSISNQKEIDSSVLPNGIYFVHVETNHKTILNQKLIIQH
ncbi:hypothetical protein BH11BAC2_BH11BAC2_03050 [soil metagenome]